MANCSARSHGIRRGKHIFEPQFIYLKVYNLFFQGTTFPALNTLLAKWIPLRERGFWGTVVFSGKLNYLIFSYTVVKIINFNRRKSHWNSGGNGA
jgi:sugar phosphate permease